jgi:hypothetical protein
MRGPLSLRQVIAVAGAVAAGCGVAAAGAPADPAPAGTAPTDTTPTGSLVVPPAAPVVNTGAATAITTSGATVRGGINAEGLQTEYWVEYGTTTAYGEQTATASAGADTTGQSVSVVLADLPVDTSFHYRVVGRNADGIAAGSGGTFTTDAAAPAVSRPAIVGDAGHVTLAGSAGLKSACVGGTSCSGSITLTHDGVTIGTRDSFALAPHAVKIVQVPVDDYGRKLLMANPEGITAQVTILNGDKPLAHRQVTLKPAEPAGHHDPLRPLS